MDTGTLTLILLVVAVVLVALKLWQLEDSRITVTPKGMALWQEAKRRVEAGEAPDEQMAVGTVLRQYVLGLVELSEEPS